MKYIRSIFIVVMCLVLLGCQLTKEPFEMQGKAGDIGDAMEHCRAFLKYTLPDDTFIYVDSASSRETIEHFDIFFDLVDSDQEGYAQCRVNKRGLISYHAIREFRQKGRSFSG
jgi:hypothetical protein